MHRRGFLFALTAAPVAAVVSPVMSEGTGHSVVLAPGPAPLPALAIPALPPRTRLVQLACVHCGRNVAMAELDEFDRPGSVACQFCWEDKVREIEEMAEGQNQDQFDYDGFNRDNLQSEYDALEADHKVLRKSADRVADKLYYMSFDKGQIKVDELRDMELVLRKHATA